MREIEFRIWHEAEKVMSYDICEWDMQNNIISYHYETDDGTICCSARSVNDVVIEQYTGLRDRNGKKIFDGDIVKGILYGEEKVALISYDIDFEGDGFPISGFYFGFDADWGDASKVKVEIIGNIHQNADLIESAEEDFE